MKEFLSLPKIFNSPPFINVGRETPIFGKNEIQALMYTKLLLLKPTLYLTKPIVLRLYKLNQYNFLYYLFYKILCSSQSNLRSEYHKNYGRSITKVPLDDRFQLKVDRHQFSMQLNIKCR